MTKEIPIPSRPGMFFLIDDIDESIVGRYRWHLGKGGYVVRSQVIDGSVRKMPLHNDLLHPPTGLLIDHKNGNHLDNRRDNLRVATHQQNSQNARPQRGTQSGCKGVDWWKQRGKWRVRISVNRRSIYLGVFDSLAYASQVYETAAKQHHGDFYRAVV